MKLIDKVTKTIASFSLWNPNKKLKRIAVPFPPQKKKKKHHFGEAFEFGPWPSEILYALGNFNLISSSPTLKLKHIRTWNVSFEILGGLGCFKGYHRVTIKPQSTLELLEATWRTPPLCNHRWNRVWSTKAAHESLHMCLHCFKGANMLQGCKYCNPASFCRLQSFFSVKPGQGTSMDHTQSVGKSKGTRQWCTGR